MMRSAVLIGLLLLAAGRSDGWAQAAPSQANVKKLVELLERAKLDSFAVKVPDTPDRYISVLLVPGQQLLVVDGRYPDPPALDARIAAKDYRGAYGDHNASTNRDGKLFVMDSRADGLAERVRTGEPFDIAYENGVTTTMFNGDWKGQRLSERDYQRKFADIEGRYDQMLAGLIAGLEARP